MWPRATEIDVRFHVGDWEMSGPVVLNVSLVSVDREGVFGPFCRFFNPALFPRHG